MQFGRQRSYPFRFIFIESNHFEDIWRFIQLERVANYHHVAAAMTKHCVDYGRVVSSFEFLNLFQFLPAVLTKECKELLQFVGNFSSYLACERRIPMSSQIVVPTDRAWRCQGADLIRRRLPRFGRQLFFEQTGEYARENSEPRHLTYSPEMAVSAGCQGFVLESNKTTSISSARCYVTLSYGIR